MKYLVALALSAPSLAATSRLYDVPDDLLRQGESSGCKFPIGANITDFNVFIPADGNDKSYEVIFDYYDADTEIMTRCDWTRESPTRGGENGLAIRHICINPKVEFIWSNNNTHPKVTVVETVCSDAGSTKLETSGGVILDLKCEDVDSSASTGAGSQCSNADEYAQFSGLSPTPFDDGPVGTTRASRDRLAISL